MKKERKYVKIKKKEKNKKKPKNRRNTDKFSAVKPELNLRIRQEEISDVAEYFDTLPLEAKRWMNKFVEEYVNDKLDREDLSNNLHNTKQLKQSCDARNNARNKDILSLHKASGMINYIEDYRGSEEQYTKDELEQEGFDLKDTNSQTDKKTDDPDSLE